MHAQRLTAAGSTLTAAALLVLMGTAGPAQALSCAPGLVPAVVEGVQACVPATSGQREPSPFYNPGESNYDPVTGHYSEAVPAVPVPAQSATVPAPVPSAEPTPAEIPAGGTAVLPAPAATLSPSPSPDMTRTPSPTPSAAPGDERVGMETVLPAAAAVVILGVLAGALLRRHRNRRG